MCKTYLLPNARGMSSPSCESSDLTRRIPVAQRFRSSSEVKDGMTKDPTLWFSHSAVRGRREPPRRVHERIQEGVSVSESSRVSRSTLLWTLDVYCPSWGFRRTDHITQTGWIDGRQRSRSWSLSKGVRNGFSICL